MAIRLAALAVASMALATPAWADVPPYIQTAFQADAVIEQFIANVTAELRRLDRDGDGLDRKDLDWLERNSRAMARANNLQAVMRYDLDGDLKVTAAEVRETLTVARSPARRSDAGAQRNLERAIQDIAWFDADADGDVELREVLAAPADRTRNVDQLATPRALMALPEATDGRLTAEELSGYARALFTSADINEDGVLSGPEAEAARKAHVSPRPARSQEVTCKLPPLRSRDQFVLVGVSDGGGPRAAPSQRIATITLRIAEGGPPLYILAASGSPVRWVLEGDVTRVSRLVAMTDDWGRRDAPLLIEGLEPPFAQARSGESCIHGFVDAAAENGLRQIEVARELLGRAPDAVIAAVSPKELRLPPR